MSIKEKLKLMEEIKKKNDAMVREYLASKRNSNG